MSDLLEIIVLNGQNMNKWIEVANKDITRFERFIHNIDSLSYFSHRGMLWRHILDLMRNQ